MFIVQKVETLHNTKTLMYLQSKLQNGSGNNKVMWGVGCNQWLRKYFVW